MAKTAAQIVTKYNRGVQNGGAAFEEGVKAVTESPMQKAIAAAPLWKQRMREAMDAGSYESGLARVPMESWKRRTAEAKGKYTASAPQATAAFQSFVNQAMPIWQQASAAVAAMPKGTDADAIARVAANMAYMKQLKGLRSTR